MRIERLTPDIDLYRGYCDDLARVLAVQNCRDRPCFGCTKLCVAHQSSVCNCECSPDCVHALTHMSSDGERFPIGAEIAPLVLAFLQLREFRPCWSCGGHAASMRAGAKPPRIIFYARSSVYPALVGEVVAVIQVKDKLSCPWEVVVTPIGNTLDATYTLQPNLAGTESPTIDQLQRDARVIADNLQTRVIQVAERYKSELSSSFRELA